MSGYKIDGNYIIEMTNQDDKIYYSIPAANVVVIGKSSVQLDKKGFNAVDKEFIDTVKKVMGVSHEPKAALGGSRRRTRRH